MDKVNIYMYHNINSIRAKDGMYGFVLETINSKGEKVTKEFFGYLSKCNINRAELRTFTAALSKLKRSCELTIYTDHEYLKSATTWCEKWQQNNWENKKGFPIANKEDWQECYGMMKEHICNFVTKTDHEYRKWLTNETERRQKTCLINSENLTAQKS